MGREERERGQREEVSSRWTNLGIIVQVGGVEANRKRAIF